LLLSEPQTQHVHGAFEPLRCKIGCDESVYLGNRVPKIIGEGFHFRIAREVFMVRKRPNARMMGGVVEAEAFVTGGQRKKWRDEFLPR